MSLLLHGVPLQFNLKYKLISVWIVLYRQSKVKLIFSVYSVYFNITELNYNHLRNPFSSDLISYA